MSRPASTSSCAAFAPNINFSRELPGFPVRYNLGPLSVVDHEDPEVEYTNYLPGHNPRVDEDPDLVHREKRARIVGQTLLLPQEPQLMLRSLVHSRAKHIIIPVPMFALNQNASCLYDIDVRNFKEPSFEGKSISACYSIICGLLGHDGGGRGHDGIGHCFPVDTPIEHKDRVKRGGGSRKKRRPAAMVDTDGEDDADGPSEPSDQILPIMDQEYDVRKCMGQRFDVTGDRNNVYKFTVRDHDLNIECEIDRYLIDFECVGRNQEDNDCFVFQNPEVMLIHIWVIDPRISLARGLERMIERNREAIAKELRTRKPDRGKQAVMQSSSGDDDVRVFDTRTLRPYETVSSWTEWARILEGVNKVENFETNYMAKFPDHGVCGKCPKYLDPVHALSPSVLFPDRGMDPDDIPEDYKPAFRYTIFKTETKETWSDRDFFCGIGNLMMLNYHEIRFTDPHYFEGLVFHPGTREMVVPWGPMPPSPAFSPGPGDMEVEPNEGPGEGQDGEAGNPDPNPGVNLGEPGPDDPYSGLSLYVYPYPNRTVRIPVTAVGSIRGLCMLFPFREQAICGVHTGMVPQTAKRPFPYQIPGIMETNYERMHELETSIASRDNGTINRRCEHDDIFNMFFGTPGEDSTAEKLNEIYTSDHRDLGRVRFTEIFPRAWRALTPSAHNIPKTLRDMLSWIDMRMSINGKKKIFADFYHPSRGFRYYRNLTAHGNFLANFMELFLQQTLRTWHNHRLYILALTFVANQMKLRHGYQPQLLFYGKTTGGKSKIMRMLQRYLIPKSISNVDSQSAAALSSHSDLDGRVMVIDEAGPTSSALFVGDPSNLRPEDDGGRSSTANALAQAKQPLSTASVDMEKKRITSGQLVRSVVAVAQDGTRTTNDIVSNIRSLSIYGSNNDYHQLDPAIRSRLFAHHVPTRGARVDTPSRKRAVIEVVGNGIKETPVGPDHDEGFRDLMCRYQAFCGLLNFMIACGAVNYSRESLNDIEETMTYRVQTVMQAIWPGFKGLNAREYADIFSNMLRATVIQRLWCEICSGCFTDPDLRPDSELTSRTFIKIQQYGLLMATEHDFFSALSYFEDMLPPAGQTAIVEWIVKKAEIAGYVTAEDSETPRRHECFRKKPRPDVTFVSDPGTTNSRASTYNHPTANRAAGQSSLRNYVTGQQVAEIGEPSSGAEWMKKYDPDYIDIGLPACTWDEFRKLVVSEIVKERDNCSRDGLVAAFNKLSYDEIQCRRTIADISHVARDVGLSYSASETFIGKAITMEKGQDTGDRYKMYILRDWLDSLCTPSGYFANQKSPVSAEFKSSPLERVIGLCSYEGAREQDILLPGMTLCNPTSRNSPIAHSMSNIMKIAKFGDELPSFGPLYISGDDYSGGGFSMGPWTREEGSDSTYEDCCYTRVLCAQMREMDIIWDNPAYPVFADKEHGAGFLERLKDAFAEYSPAFSNARFHERFAGKPGREYPKEEIELQAARIINPVAAGPVSLVSIADKMPKPPGRGSHAPPPKKRKVQHVETPVSEDLCTPRSSHSDDSDV